MSGYVTDPEITQFISLADLPAPPDPPDLSGYVTSSEITEFISASDIPDIPPAPDLSGYVTRSELRSATDGLVDSSVTDGLPTNEDLRNATDGLASTASVVAATSGLVSSSDIPDLSNYATNAALRAATAGFVTGSVTDGLATVAGVNAGLTLTINSLNSTIQSATSGLVSNNDLAAATSGLGVNQDNVHTEMIRILELVTTNSTTGTLNTIGMRWFNQANQNDIQLQVNLSRLRSAMGL